MADLNSEIKRVEGELYKLADMEDKLRRYAKREEPGEHRKIVENQLAAVTLRANYVEAELMALQAARDHIESVRKLADARAAFIARPLVNFFHIEEAA